ncbi:MAG: hypothetical protein LUO95_06815 [Methylococcaceae bacterium]|nr:hypothetical protein [Methylococcaceae bacterium]
MRANNASDTNKPVTVKKSSLYQTADFSVRPTSSLAIAIAATLSGYLISATPVQAAFNMPTDMTPSPLCINGSCATEFTAKMLMFEEFGLKDASSSSTSSSTPFPVPSDCFGIPDGAALDNFLKEDLHSIPTRKSDKLDDDVTPITASNPWATKVKDCLGLAADMAMPADGRPGGEDFAHQRWSEFPTQAYFQSAQTGARVNGGLRDKKQLHDYKKGEFGPNGLYYMDANGDGIPGTAGISIKIHPNLPTQDPTQVIDGTLW